MEFWTDDFGLVVQVHSNGECMFEYCTVHNNSIHPLCLAPQRWNITEGIMQRQCVHGQFHVDRDEIRAWGLVGMCNKNSCDLCCLGKDEEYPNE